MHVPDSRAHADDLEHVVREHSKEPVEILFVEDILAWCRERNGETRGNPIGMAIRDSASKQAGILIRRHIDADQIRSAKDRLLFGGFESLAARLDTPGLFLRHLVLHELAHLINDCGQEAEDECDAWAFRAMGW